MMLQVVADILRRRQTTGWLVGGSVRDRELGRYSPDLDVTVADDPAAVAREAASALGAPWFALSERHLAYRVVGREGRIDVAALRGGGILEDLAQRDFTVNAMAVSVSGEDLIDPFGGLTHLRQRRLVAVSGRVFIDDPLRLMRAARFCHVLGLQLDNSLAELVRSQAPVLVRAAPERIAAEMALTLAAGRSAVAARLWRDLGLLAVVLPEVTATERLTMTVTLLGRLDDLLARPSVWFPEAAGPLAERFAQPVDGALSRPVALRLAGLLHGLSAQEAAAAGRRLKLSAAMVSLLQVVSGRRAQGRDDRAGLADGELVDEAALGGRAATRRAVLFLWDTVPWEPEVIALAALAAAETDDPSGVSPVVGPARRLMAFWAERKVNGVPRLPLDGTALMRELGLDGGPLLGRVLREARLVWEAGEATTATEVLAVARAVLRMA
jgi:tRNA nucleotidyltransferase/poly(A) polymerase